MADKKKHHFIAQTYLRGFCSGDGKLCVYSKDKPRQHWWAAPDSVAFEKYYYSQPTPDGGQDNNRLEDFFCSIETGWPKLVAKIERGEQRPGGLDELLLFALMHRVRVPTARDGVEKMLAEAVRMTARHLNDLGELPPPPPGLSFEYLDQHTQISIDPHKSIHAMTDLAKGFIKIVRAVGFRLIENATNEGFISSDNPVIYFDPIIPPQSMQPYNISRERMDIEFMFPITPKLMLWGHSRLKLPHGAALYQTIDDKTFIRRANVCAARFAHRMVFSSESRHQALVDKYADLSPVISVKHLVTRKGRGIVAQSVFGRREPKPKWNRRDRQEKASDDVDSTNCAAAGRAWPEPRPQDAAGLA
jgi:hypothetical protein